MTWSVMVNWGSGKVSQAAGTMVRTHKDCWGGTGSWHQESKSRAAISLPDLASVSCKRTSTKNRKRSGKLCLLSFLLDLITEPNYLRKCTKLQNKHNFSFNGQ